jgi:hypothetical protein
VARIAELTMVFADMQSLQTGCGCALIEHVLSYVVVATDVTGRPSGRGRSSARRQTIACNALTGLLLNRTVDVKRLNYQPDHDATIKQACFRCNPTGVSTA